MKAALKSVDINNKLVTFLPQVFDTEEIIDSFQ